MKGALPTAVLGPNPPPGAMVRASTIGATPVPLVQATTKVPLPSPTTSETWPVSVRADKRTGGPQLPPAGRTEAYVGLPLAIVSEKAATALPAPSTAMRIPEGVGPDSFVGALHVPSAVRLTTSLLSCESQARKAAPASLSATCGDICSLRAP
jgi:hypothetical protein